MGAMPSNAAVDMNCKYKTCKIMYQANHHHPVVVIFVVQGQETILAWVNAINYQLSKYKNCETRCMKKAPVRWARSASDLQSK